LMRVAASVGALMVALAIVTAPAANAHAVLVGSDPVDGSRLAASPATVELTFDEPVKLIPAAVQVISSSGTRVDDGATLRPGGTTIVLALPQRLARGSYTAMWRVSSADTHEVAGSITFGVDQDPLTAPVPIAVADPLGLTADVTRGVGYAGLVLSVGVGGVCRLLWPWALALRRTRVLVGLGWVLLVAGTAVEFALTGPRSLGLGWPSVIAGEGLSQTAASTGGLVLMLRAGCMVALAALWRLDRSSAPVLRRRLASVLAATTVVLLAATIAVDGHAGVGSDALLAAAVTTLHLLAMSTWLGGLLVLAVIVLPANRDERLQQWSVTAFGCVAVLVLSGEYQAWRQVSPIEALWSTGYGITLLAKLVGVLAMVGLAVWGRRRLTTEVLRRTVPVEALIGVAVLVVTTVLVAQPPARTVYGPPVTLAAPLENDRTAVIDVSSTRRGPIRIELAVRNTGGSALPVQAVTATLSSVDAGIAALPVRWRPGPAGHWLSTYASTPRPGTWTLHLIVGFTATDVVASTAAFRVW
jgi:copper transport protein